MDLHLGCSDIRIALEVAYKGQMAMSVTAMRGYDAIVQASLVRGAEKVFRGSGG